MVYVTSCLKTYKMRIKFKLNGIDREIKWDGKCFHALEPGAGNDRAFGYYTTIQGAIKKHIKEAAILDTAIQEEVISLEKLADRFQSLLSEAGGLDPDKLPFKDVIMADRPGIKPSSKITETIIEDDEDEF